MESIKLLLFSIVLLCMLATGFSIKCFECRSMDDPKCADPFDNTTLSTHDCKGKTLPHLPGVEATMCKKIRQKFLGQWRYFRSCAFMGEPGIGGDERFCLMRTGTYNIFSEYCTCNSKDGCNSSNFLLPTFLLIIISVSLASIIKLTF